MATAEQLAATPEQAAADMVKTSPGTPQLLVRRRALREGRTVYVVVPRLRDEGCFYELDPARIDNEHLNSMPTVSHVEIYTGAIDPDALPPVDLVVSRSIVVPETGARAGEDEEFSDLKYAMLWELEAITMETIVAMTVHERQVRDDLPKLDAHGVPIDFVVTPGRLIRTGTSYPRPEGTNRDALPDERLEEMPVLRQLRNELGTVDEQPNSCLFHRPGRREAMRLVQILMPAGKRKVILQALDEEDVDYAVSKEASGRGFVAVVTFPIPKEAIEPVLARLREAGVERGACTVVVATKTIASKRFDQLREQYEEDDESDDRIAREELVSKATDLAPSMLIYVLMAVISVLVATMGLPLNSPVVVVGSMVIAPLVGPAVSASVGTVVNDDGIFACGVHLQVLGGLLAISATVALALLLKQTRAVPLLPVGVLSIPGVGERLAPDVLSLVIALGTRAAGATPLSSGVSTTLVGVMTAAASVPPTTVASIGAAWGVFEVVVGPAILVLINILSANFVVTGVLWR